MMGPGFKARFVWFQHHPASVPVVLGKDFDTEAKDKAQCKGSQLWLHSGNRNGDRQTANTWVKLSRVFNVIGLRCSWGIRTFKKVSQVVPMCSQG